MVINKCEGAMEQHWAASATKNRRTLWMVYLCSGAFVSLNKSPIYNYFIIIYTSLGIATCTHNNIPSPGMMRRWRRSCGSNVDDDDGNMSLPLLLLFYSGWEELTEIPIELTWVYLKRRTLWVSPKDLFRFTKICSKEDRPLSRRLPRITTIIGM